MGGIRLHPKHGLNPTLLVCAICGKDYGVGLLGALYKEEAPRQSILPGELCGVCEKKYITEAKGVMLLAATPMPYRGEQRLTPTGDFIILTEEAFNRCFHMKIPPNRRVYADPEIIRMLTHEAAEEVDKEKP